MPLNGGGTASRVPGTSAAPNQTIKSADYNAEMDDVYSILNTARPIAYGGTGATTAVGGADALSTRGTAIASAATTDLSAATGRFVHVTGTTTITSLGTAAAGVERVVTFDGALTITHNATSLILPGAFDITTVAGDTFTFVSEGSGNWRCTNYERAVAGAEYEFISEQSVSGVGAVDFTDLDDYDELLLKFVGGSTGSDAQLFFRLSTDNGASYLSGVSDYAHRSLYASGPATSSTGVAAATASVAIITATSVRDVAASGLSTYHHGGHVKINSFNKAGITIYAAESNYFNSSAQLTQSEVVGYGPSSAMNALRFGAVGVNFSGNVKLYGRKG